MGFINIRPSRYSLTLDLHPDNLPPVANVKRKLKLGDAIHCSYHLNEVKFSDLTLDNFRMLRYLEWEPSGSFYKSSGTMSIGTGQNGGFLGSNRTNYSFEDLGQQN